MKKILVCLARATKKFVLVGVLLAVSIPVPSKAAIVMENHINPAFPYVACYMNKKANLFSFPKITFHIVSIYSVHYSTKSNGDVINLHAQAKLAWETDAISKGHKTYEGLSAHVVHMETEFYYERCIANGIIEFERNKHKEREC